MQDVTDDLNLFEVSPANDVVVPALDELITHYKWKKVALIVENKQEYSQVSSCSCKAVTKSPIQDLKLNSEHTNNIVQL